MSFVKLDSDLMLYLVRFAHSLDDAMNPFSIDGRSRKGDPENFLRESSTKANAMKNLISQLHESCTGERILQHQFSRVSGKALELAFRKILVEIPTLLAQDALAHYDFLILGVFEPEKGKSREAMRTRVDTISCFNLSCHDRFLQMKEGFISTFLSNTS
jgi:hypothetical protein